MKDLKAVDITKMIFVLDVLDAQRTIETFIWVKTNDISFILRLQINGICHSMLYANAPQNSETERGGPNYVDPEK